MHLKTLYWKSKQLYQKQYRILCMHFFFFVFVRNKLKNSKYLFSGMLFYFSNESVFFRFSVLIRKKLKTLKRHVFGKVFYSHIENFPFFFLPFCCLTCTKAHKIYVSCNVVSFFFISGFVWIFCALIPKYVKNT